ncbi:MAG: hypothetical protein D6732_09760 [Methanobacteriota archaeon]|nr:MAG: hypothetical protein D6732_09760 [Euryarchaeota archaeon]
MKKMMIKSKVNFFGILTIPQIETTRLHEKGIGGIAILFTSFLKNLDYSFCPDYLLPNRNETWTLKETSRMNTCGKGNLFEFRISFQLQMELGHPDKRFFPIL